MRYDSERLTLRGATPLLKRALDIRAKREQISAEKTVLAILERDLAPEIKVVQEQDNLLDKALV
jgi:plasmid stability protein